MWVTDRMPGSAGWYMISYTGPWDDDEKARVAYFKPLEQKFYEPRYRHDGVLEELAVENVTAWKKLPNGFHPVVTGGYEMPSIEETIEARLHCSNDGNCATCILDSERCRNIDLQRATNEWLEEILQLLNGRPITEVTADEWNELLSM